MFYHEEEGGNEVWLGKWDCGGFYSFYFILDA